MKVAFFSLWIILVGLGIAQSDSPEVELDTTPKQEMLQDFPSEEEPALEIEF